MLRLAGYRLFCAAGKFWGDMLDCHCAPCTKKGAVPMTAPVITIGNYPLLFLTLTRSHGSIVVLLLLLMRSAG